MNMTVDDVKQRIAVANSTSDSLNNARQVNIGKRDALTKQLEAGLKAYNDAYGVQLTSNDLEAEMVKVSEKKAKELEQLEVMIRLISEGNYDEANNLVNGTAATENPVEQAPAQEVQPVVEAEHPVIQEEAHIVETQVVPQTELAVEQPTIPEMPTSPVTPVVNSASVIPPVAHTSTVLPIPPVTEPSIPVPTVQPATPMGNMFDGAMQGFTTPQGVGAPIAQTVAQPTNFQDILSGSDFNPKTTV